MKDVTSTVAAVSTALIPIALVLAACAVPASAQPAFTPAEQTFLQALHSPNGGWPDLGSDAQAVKIGHDICFDLHGRQDEAAVNHTTAVIAKSRPDWGWDTSQALVVMSILRLCSK
jgi:hypothetical protein